MPSMDKTRKEFREWLRYYIKNYDPCNERWGFERLVIEYFNEKELQVPGKKIREDWVNRVDAEFCGSPRNFLMHFKKDKLQQAFLELLGIDEFIEEDLFCPYWTEEDEMATIKRIKRLKKADLVDYILLEMGFEEYDRPDLDYGFIEVNEKQIQYFLFDCPVWIEKGFKPISMEYPTPVGFIDIFGVDSRGNHVAVEVKAKVPGDSVIGQITRYMGYLKEKYGGGIRGIIVCPYVTPKLKSSISLIENLDITEFSGIDMFYALHLG